mmetsp:Transcript_65023/g.190225  ORF Transcript_65023/g.190225 Transcript_65023/m.190225 type:complete len:211 (+) Transcript_65023:1321-1953(+)
MLPRWIPSKGCSWTSLNICTFGALPHFKTTLVMKRRSISTRISKCLGSISRIMLTGHISKASAVTLLLVKLQVSLVNSQASSQPTLCTSTKRRITSMMAIAEGASLICMEALSGRSRHLRPGFFMNSRSRSWRDALTKKYCCLMRIVLSLDLSSFGYGTADKSSARCLAWPDCSRLLSPKAARSISAAGHARQSLKLFVVLELKPEIGLS